MSDAIERSPGLWSIPPASGGEIVFRDAGGREMVKVESGGMSATLRLSPRTIAALALLDLAEGIDATPAEWPPDFGRHAKIRAILDRVRGEMA